MSETSNEPDRDPELAKIVSGLTSRFHLREAWLDKHPEPERIELLTRDTDSEGSRAKTLGKIVSNLHDRYAKGRAEDIAQGNEPQDDPSASYCPLSLDDIAEGGSVHLTIEGLQEDVEVIAIELVGLLWRLEDAGVIKHTETIVEAAGVTASMTAATVDKPLSPEGRAEARRLIAELTALLELRAYGSVAA
jgi:hypothetical protein